MARASAATQRPGRTSAATQQDPAAGADTTPVASDNVAARAAKARVEGAVDPTTLRKPVFTDEGWVCPAPKPKAE